MAGWMANEWWDGWRINGGMNCSMNGNMNGKKELNGW